MMAILGGGIQKVHLLVEHGAKIDYKTESGQTAAVVALMMEDIETAYYLIVEKKAIITQPYYDFLLGKKEPMFPVELLLDLFFDIGSKKYEQKMAIVQEFKNQGIDYFSYKKNIDEKILRKIKKVHPYDWQNYIEKY
jgi:hypothetical protein